MRIETFSRHWAGKFDLRFQILGDELEHSGLLRVLVGCGGEVESVWPRSQHHLLLEYIPAHWGGLRVERDFRVRRCHLRHLKNSLGFYGWEFFECLDSNLAAVLLDVVDAILWILHAGECEKCQIFTKHQLYGSICLQFWVLVLKGRGPRSLCGSQRGDMGGRTVCYTFFIFFIYIYCIYCSFLYR
jgi:hypothetical protein